MVNSIMENEQWPPEGYRSYDYPGKSWLVALAIGVTIATIILVLFFDSLSNLADFVVDLSQLTIDMNPYPYLEFNYALMVMVTFISIFIIGCITIVTHELLHFLTFKGFDIPARFTWSKNGIVPNPAIVPLGQGTDIRHHMIASIVPFLTIGISSVIGIFLFDGYVEGILFFCLLVNSGPSGADLWDFHWFSNRHQDTILATFAENGDYRFEYAVPVNE